MEDKKIMPCVMTVLNELCSTKRVRYDQFIGNASIPYVAAFVAAGDEVLREDVDVTCRSHCPPELKLVPHKVIPAVNKDEKQKSDSQLISIVKEKESEPICQIDDKTFQEHFGMDRQVIEELFRQILTKVQEIEDKGRGRSFFCPCPKKVLLTAWLLCTQESFNSVADRFKVSKGTVHVIFISTCKLLLQRVEDFIQWPDYDHQRATSTYIETRYGFPGVAGAVGELLIRESVKSGSKVSSSVVILQGVCDASQCFVDVSIGQPGNPQPTRSIIQTPLFVKLSDDLGSFSEDHHLLGDLAYPLMTTLMTPFPDDGLLTAQQIKYNHIHFLSYSIIFRTFARLLGRFRRLKSLHMSREDLVPTVIHAVCCLHNFIVRHEDVESNDYGMLEETEPVEPYFNILCPEMSAFEKRDTIVQRLDAIEETN